MKEPLPQAALDRHIAILGKTGSGKSNTAKVIAEALMQAGERVCAIDPTGTWWGVRLAEDGKRPSKFKPVIFGGNHADIQITGDHGAPIAEAIATSSTSAIIDTRLLTVGARTKFFTAFGEALLRTNRGALHLIIDEAHLFAPQGRVNDPQSGAMLHAANNLVSLGRGIGLRIILISQRPAKLHKDSLTQAETLIAMRLIAPQDRRAIEEWIGEWAEPGKGKEIVAGLPSLPTGTAWVWSPEIDMLEKKTFPLAATFDSGKPAANGDGPSLAPIDVDAMTARLETIRADVVANDPTRLKRQIAELQKQIAAAPKATVDPKDIEAAEKRGFEQGELRGYPAGYRDGRADAVLKMEQALSEIANPPQPTDSATPSKPAFHCAVCRGSRLHYANCPEAKPGDEVYTFGSPVLTAKRAAPDARGSAEDVQLGAERKPLALLVSAYPAGYTEAQWASLAGFKRSGGTWGTYKSRLRTKAMVEQRGDLWFATEAAVAAIGGDLPEMPKHPEDRLALWKSKLSGVGPMLDALRNHYPVGLTRDDLAMRCGLSASGGTFGTYLSRLRTNGLVEEPERGLLRLSSAIMGDI